jgi:PKD repeat protein
MKYPYCIRPDEKNIFFRIFFAVLILTAGLTGKAQIKAAGGSPPPTDPCGVSRTCMVNTLNISTGYNQSSNTYNTPPATETNWELISGPAAASLPPNPPCYDIAAGSSWGSFTNARWVSPFSNASYSVDNCPPNSVPFLFQKCFCVCGSTTITLSFDMMVDDGAEIYLDGALIATAMLGNQFTLSSRLIFSNNYTLASGQHCLFIKLYNCGQGDFGFALQGSITGLNLVAPSCCAQSTTICGTKVNDTDCDGTIELGEPGMSGWTIELRDNLGNLIATQVTDASGNYCFTGLNPGSYVVSEVNQTGWTQTYPASPGSHSLSLTQGSAGIADFANCIPAPPPCDGTAVDFTSQMNQCQVKFISMIPLPPGYQLVSTRWNFGDGTGSDELNPVHYYATPGSYNVCLTVTVFNGKECCTQTICHQTHSEPCNGGCSFDANIVPNFNSDKCEFEFTANISFAGTAVTDIFWDFGDGTFASGNPVTHSFASTGTYNVCVYIMGNDGRNCCFQQFCADVDVPCTPCDNQNPDGSTKSANNNIEISDKNIIVLDQNVPNPFAENTLISYNIPMAFTRAQLIFTNAEGKLIKAVDITKQGKGQFNVFANDLSTGVYTYTLVVDGKTIDTRRMIKN